MRQLCVPLLWWVFKVASSFSCMSVGSSEASLLPWTVTPTASFLGWLLPVPPQVGLLTIHHTDCLQQGPLSSEIYSWTGFLFQKFQADIPLADFKPKKSLGFLKYPCPCPRGMQLLPNSGSLSSLSLCLSLFLSYVPFRLMAKVSSREALPT